MSMRAGGWATRIHMDDGIAAQDLRSPQSQRARQRDGSNCCPDPHIHTRRGAGSRRSVRPTRIHMDACRPEGGLHASIWTHVGPRAAYTHPYGRM